MTKLFVGSLPNGVTDDVIWAEFGKYGQVTEVYVKPDCEPGRQWAKVEMADYNQALAAKNGCDRILTLPGAAGPCDVQIAKNQGKGSGGGGDFAAQGFQGGGGGGDFAAQGFQGGEVVPRGPTMAQYAPTKVFVGCLPDGTTDHTVREYFGQHGEVSDVYLKPGCESGRQWAFVTLGSHDQALHVIEMTNGMLLFPGAVKPCEVMLARNQGMFGQDKLVAGPRGPESISFEDLGPKKIFVGTLPDGISDMSLRQEFGKFGTITDIYMKQGCEPGRQWAFVTFSTSDAASTAKMSCDRVLTFPGAVGPCEVTLAKNQGMFGQNLLGERPGDRPGGGKGEQPVRLFNGGGGQPGWAGGGYAQQGYAVQPAVEGPRKVFVGSLPDHINDQILRAEFSRYGQVVDVFLKQGCESGRQWAFVTFGTSEQAQYAKDSTDRILVIPGAEKACEVMLAKNQGKNGAEPLQGGGGGGHFEGGGYAIQQQAAWNPAPMSAIQPPPPSSPHPSQAIWREYKTASGLPYYHNHATGVTQWEAPAELQMQQMPQADPFAAMAQAPVAADQYQYQDLMQTAYGAVPNPAVGQTHYAPY